MNDYDELVLARKRFWRDTKVDWLKNFLIIAAFGIAFFIASVFMEDDSRTKTVCIITGVLLCLPAFVHFYVLTIWHWGIRYDGKHKLLWGAILFIETTGWMKTVYLIRHVIPDYTSDKNSLVERASV